MVRVKVCGVTSVQDALACAQLGVDAIGLNFYEGSPRYIDRALGKAIVAALPAHVITVGVFVDAGFSELAEIQRATGIRCLQLHGDEPPELLARFLPHAYKALRVKGPEVVERVTRFGGEHILLDAYSPAAHGGTGAIFDWRIAAEIARTRLVTLAGGLSPENVQAAVCAVRPFCVDVASGVESAPGKKDLAKVKSFLTHARAGSQALQTGVLSPMSQGKP